MKDHAAEATIAAVANKVAVAGGGWAFLGGVTANTIAALGGLVVGVVGLLVQWYYKRKSDRREDEFYKARLRELERGHGG